MGEKKSRLISDADKITTNVVPTGTPNITRHGAQNCKEVVTMNVKYKGQQF